ncbi:MAG: hypothetical protein WCT77_12525 [Bacteroidota bacterium]
MNIIKIGGAVLRNKEGFFQMLEIIKEYRNEPLLIVISAFSNATRMLGKAASIAASGELQTAKNILMSIKQTHINYTNELLNNSVHIRHLNEAFTEGENKILDYLKGLSITRELTPRTKDAILSYGEYFALITVENFLREQGKNIICIDSTSVIVSDSNFGAATPMLTETKKKVQDIILPHLNNNSIVLTQGFVARNIKGDITTMGIESSNLTATLLAELLEAKELTFWTDVEGFRSADPKIVNNTKPIQEVNYETAYKLAVNGLKLVYPGMLDYAKQNNIKLRYRSALTPNGYSTVISINAKALSTPVFLLMENLVKYNYQFYSEELREQIAKHFLEEHSAVQNIFHYELREDSLIIYSGSAIPDLLKNFHTLEPVTEQNCSAITVFNLSSAQIQTCMQTITQNIFFGDIFDIVVNRSNQSLQIFCNGPSASAILNLLHSAVNG